MASTGDEDPGPSGREFLGAVLAVVGVLILTAGQVVVFGFGHVLGVAGFPASILTVWAGFLASWWGGRFMAGGDRRAGRELRGVAFLALAAAIAFYLLFLGGFAFGSAAAPWFLVGTLAVAALVLGGARDLQGAWPWQPPVGGVRRLVWSVGFLAVGIAFLAVDVARYPRPPVPTTWALGMTALLAAAGILVAGSRGATLRFAGPSLAVVPVALVATVAPAYWTRRVPYWFMDLLAGMLTAAVGTAWAARSPSGTGRRALYLGIAAAGLAFAILIFRASAFLGTPDI